MIVLSKLFLTVITLGHPPYLFNYFLAKVLQKPEPIVIEQIAQHLGSIGAIHQTQPELNPG